MPDASRCTPEGGLRLAESIFTFHFSISSLGRRHGGYGLNLVRDKIQSSRGAKAKWPDNGDVARELGIQKPANWDWPEKVNANKLAFAWADEILPLAREAHERLEYSQVFFPKGNEKLARGYATERAIKAGQLPYRDWSGGVVRDKLHVAGWRLAALLDSVLE